MSDTKCCVCSKAQSTEDNQLLRCSERNCGITVHQHCYGVLHIPQHKWFCKKCEPFSMIRAAKVRCRFCPLKDGALKPTSVDAKKEDWAHILCALWIPGISFDDNETRNMIDISKYEAQDPSACMLCVEEGRHSVASTGTCISCSTAGCSKKFHVTCAHKRGLLNLSAIERPQAASSKSTLTARCSVCMMKKTGVSSSGKPQDGATNRTAGDKERDRSGTSDTKAAATKGMHSGVSKAPNLQRSKVAATTYMCRIKRCGRSYFSEQGVKYHMKHHHTADEAIKAPTHTKPSHESEVLSESATKEPRDRRSVEEPPATAAASKTSGCHDDVPPSASSAAGAIAAKVATAPTSRKLRGSREDDPEGGGDAKRQKVGDRTRSMTSRGLPRIGRAKDLPCYKSVVGLIGGRNFGGLSTVEGKGAYRAMVKHAAGDEIERHAIDVLHRLEDVQCKTLQVIEDVGALQAEKALLEEGYPAGPTSDGSGTPATATAGDASHAAALTQLADDGDALNLVLNMVLQAMGLPHSVVHAVELDHVVTVVNNAVADVPRGTPLLPVIQRALQSAK